ncbi:MAG: AAA domain-containing protein, partial [Clostridia bacterium]|nr:AAA domain-containing protein [Clostridia bacterium]
MRTIYNKYKERLIEISGRNRSLFLRRIVKKYSFDIGALLEKNNDNDLFLDFLWQSKRTYTLLNDKIAKKLCKRADSDADDAQPSEVEVLTKSIADLKYLKREVEELEKETGRYELYIGYPFVIGAITQDIPVRAPLLLFPAEIEIDRDTAKLNFIPNHPVSLNKSFVLAYSKEHNIKTENLIQEFDPQNDSNFHNPSDVIEYLIKLGFKIKYQKRKGVLLFDDGKEQKTEGLEIKNMAVLGRFPLANSIYNDYLQLEKDNLSTPSIDMLLKGKSPATGFFKRKKKPVYLPPYAINDLDYAQENAIEEINRHDNIVIYGPPGTGKSQTIVNIISDALCKNKKVLVVSQKRAALDVVFSRLGKLNAKAMLMPDPEKDKQHFFDRLKQMHSQTLSNDFSDSLKKYNRNELNINKELDTLKNISDTLFNKTPFGLSLQEMYAESYNIGKDTKDYLFYKAMLSTNIINRNYAELDEDLKLIKDKDLPGVFITKLELARLNPMVEHIRTDLDMHKLKEAHAFITKTLSEPLVPFNAGSYPYSRYLTTFYLEDAASDRKSIYNVADIITRIEHPSLSKWISYTAFPALWPLYPVLKMKFNKLSEDIMIDLNIARHALELYASQFAALKSVLDKEGFALAIGGLINGNAEFLKKLLSALENYVAIRDMNKELAALTPGVAELLSFAYKNSNKDLPTFRKAVDRIMAVRIYHEIIEHNDYIEERMSKTVMFDSFRERILSLKSDQRELSKALAMDRFSYEYTDFFNDSEHSKDYLYQIQKQRALWPVRRMIEYFDQYLFRLFPCWLLSPQAVSTVLPLKKDMFDLVVFDEASQIFIEAALPSIYRGTRIVVAGDNKQLRPTSGFVRRYLGDDSFDYNMDLSTQAALEVESLLDLATAKYQPVNLSYHYRSGSAELIDFSNMAFYENRLQIAPNITKNADNPPIERIKVKGNWKDRHNHEEALAVTKLVKTLLKERTANESMGIVTFNIEQKEYIEDMLDAEADKNTAFRRDYAREQNRVIDGENSGIFVKNLENVQGDERDIIIFSVGYARNDSDKVVAQFGSLSMEGGENRLNVAITRARRKVYVVTSIEPEELDNADVSKNNGPKLLKKYLQYARAVSEMKEKEIKHILSSFDTKPKAPLKVGAYEEQIKEELEKLGYSVDTNLGNTNYKLSLGVYDSTLNMYVLGIECDYQAYNSSDSVLERDVYRIKFLESRG